MGCIHHARKLQRTVGTYDAAVYLKRQGYTIRASMWILAGQTRVLP